MPAAGSWECLLPMGVLAFFIAVAGTINIVADYRRSLSLKYVTKPLTTLLIVALALTREPVDRTYQVFIVIGLLFSLAGDVFLMLPEEPRSHFLAGLASFFLAHVCYIGGFSVRSTWAWSHVAALLVLALVGAGLCGYLWRRLGPLKGPVLCYTAIIVGMAWRATARLDAPEVPKVGAVLAMIGALLFMLSDACLAVARFARSFHASRAIVLSTYFTAQTLIAMSVRT